MPSTQGQSCPQNDGEQRRAQREDGQIRICAEIHHLRDGFSHPCVEQRHNKYAQEAEHRRQWRRKGGERVAGEPNLLSLFHLYGIGVA